MLKFLRKYNKFILVVGGVLLMIVFVAPQAIQQLGPNPMNRTVAFIGDRAVTAAEADRAAQEREAVLTFSPGFAQVALGINPSEPAIHWLLLAEEAERAGFVAEISDGEEWLPELARELQIMDLAFNQGRGMATARDWVSRGFFDEQIAQAEQQLRFGWDRARATSRMTDVEFARTLSKARGVYRMIEAYRNAPKLSESRAALATKHDRDQAAVDVVFISAARVASLEAISATDEEVMAHYERFRDDDGTDNEYGFGYTLPARAKVAWMAIDPEDIIFNIDIDPVTVRKEYLKNRETYPGELSEESLTIESVLKQAEVEKVMGEADRIIREQTAPAMSRLPKEGVHRALPEGENPFPSWESIAEAVVAGVKEATGHDISTPAVQVRDSRWYDGNALSALPGVGSARVRSGSTEGPFAAAVLSVKELNPDDTLGLQVGVPMVRLPAIDSGGTRYYYTVLDVRDTSPPDSPREIWDRLVRDTREYKGYEALAERADEILSQAKAEGLSALAERYSPESQPTPEELAALEGTYEPGEWEKTPLMDLAVEQDVIVRWDPNRLEGGRPELRTESFAETVMEQAKQLDPLIIRDDLPEELRWVSVMVPESRGLAVGQIGVWSPMTQEAFWREVSNSTDRQRIEEVFQQEGFETVNPFGFEAMSDRLGYRSLDGDDEDPVEPETEES